MPNLVTPNLATSNLVSSNLVTDDGSRDDETAQVLRDRAVDANAPEHAPIYRLGARAYSVLSLERPVYRAGRLAGIDMLRLRPGDRVLDVGCGTGLNLPLLVAAVGSAGQVVGVDASGPMLARARARVRRHGWANVHLVEADAADLAYSTMDAVLFTYSLSIIHDWRRAWAAALRALRPGRRVVVVDIALPTRWPAPLDWLMRTTGGVHPQRRMWEQIRADTGDLDKRVLRGGHIRVAAGSRPDGRP
jgi:ubiquinone/menaquinone biosynthesis C-methylase UbiE